MMIPRSRWFKFWLVNVTVIFMIGQSTHAYCQHAAASNTVNVSDLYNSALKELMTILSDSDNGCQDRFEKAVFLTENAFYQDTMSEREFTGQIAALAILAKEWMAFNPNSRYKYEDSLNVQRNLAIFKVLKDTIRIQVNETTIHLLPYTYDFNDFFGESDWSNMFVSKLLATHSGNCHSLPFLYKILADRIGAPCWLSLAPCHTYIANRCKKIGWYNTELTSGQFPIDAWIMASGYIPVEAIQNGIYMDTLSNQESIALCILDLAKGYEHQTGNYYNGFILKCCDLSLQYFPKNVQAMLLKAETLKRIYERQAKMNGPARKATYHEMEGLYVKLFTLGYREMPEKMYMDWLQSVINERDKYANKLIREVN